MKTVAPCLTALLMVILGCSRSGPSKEAESKRTVPAGPAQKCVVDKLSPVELRAVKDVGAIALLGSICGATNFDTLYSTGCAHKESGFELQIPPLQGQMKDPRQDPDYDFYFQVDKRPDGKGLDAKIAYDPKRPGLAGVFTDGAQTFCNSLGRASVRPDLLMSQTEINDAVARLKASSKGNP